MNRLKKRREKITGDSLRYFVDKELRKVGFKKCEGYSDITAVGPDATGLAHLAETRAASVTILQHC
jgi:hypothetical protein